MTRLPEDYINFIAKGIAHNLKAEGFPVKETYTEQDLMEVFQCATPEDLYKKIEEIETKTITALGLPNKESYSYEEIETQLNLAPGMIQSMEGVLDKLPDHS